MHVHHAREPPAGSLCIAQRERLAELKRRSGHCAPCAPCTPSTLWPAVDRDAADGGLYNNWQQNVMPTRAEAEGYLRTLGQGLYWCKLFGIPERVNRISPTLQIRACSNFGTAKAVTKSGRRIKITNLRYPEDQDSPPL